MKTQAWGWLAAGVLAAGLNASYHDGGLEWAHRIADWFCQDSAALLALASGQADRFLAEAQLVTARSESASCPLSTVLARIRTKLGQDRAGSDAGWARVEAMSARDEAQLARFEASRARIEARVARIRIPAVAFSPVSIAAPRISVCPRVRVNIPRMPAIKMPMMPVVHVESVGAGPV
jgi:hypothetical protein